MKRFFLAILLICLLTGCSIFKSEHYFGYSCEGSLSQFSSYCKSIDQKKKNNPEAVAWLKKSRTMMEEKNWSEVIRMASVAISIDPFYADAYALRSWAYLERGFRENALIDAEAALQLEPENTSALNNRGLYYLRSDNSMKAKDNFTRACQGGLRIGCDNMKLVIDYCLKKTEEAFRKNDWDGVIKFTSEIAENEVALSVRCGAYASKGQLEAAITDCDAAIKMKPDLAMAYNNKGYALELMGKKKEAALNYEFACNLNMLSGCSSLKKLTESKKEK